MSKTVEKLIATANEKLNDQELRDLFDAVRALIISRQNAQAAQLVTKFSPGQEVEFVSSKKRGATVRLKITKIGIKNVQGTELYRNGLFLPKNDKSNEGLRWKVHPSLLTKVG